MFSIIMPVWNRAKMVKRAIKSVLAQTFTDYELLIVDDGSEDGLKEAVRPHLSEKVIYHRIPHSGVSAARNFGIRHAKRRYFAYLDSDNVWHEDFLATMGKALEEAGGRYEAAYCIALVYRKLEGNGPLYLSEVRSGPFSLRKVVGSNYIDINTFVHTRKCVEQVGLFDEGLRRLVDWDYIMRIAWKFEPLFVPKVLVDYYYGVAENAITLKEDYEAAVLALRAKTPKVTDQPVVHHDDHSYSWSKAPEQKYYNWVRANNEEMDTTDFKAYGYPYMLQIEPTNICNLSCPLCPAGRGELNRPRRHMTLEEFKGIIDDMERWLLLTVLWDWGEPFTNPQLAEMIRYATQRRIATVTSTNAQFLNDETRVEAILKSGLSTLIVAIDSICEANYEAYRKRGDLDKALGGLTRLVQMKRRLDSKTMINLRTIVMRQNEQELDQIREVARRIGVDVFTVKSVNPTCGTTAHDAEMAPLNPKYRRYQYKEGTFERIRVDAAVCRQVWSTANIHSNGNVVPCCYHYDDELAVGNVFKQPFSELWNGPAYRALRKRIYQDKDSIPRCRECWINYKLSESGWFVESTRLKR